ncbi:MAG: hypothetical protein NW226_10670 [Microscillaceae bacterium]|nr:hypothetical protein [Microscillaceae bacterium]
MKLSTRCWAIFLISLFSYVYTQAQDKDSTATQRKIKLSWGFKGQISASTDIKDNLFVHFGGPGITLSANKLGLFIGMYPSIRFYDQTQISPLLGMGMQFMVGKWVFPVLVHNINSQNNPDIVFTYGLGYRF